MKALHPPFAVELLESRIAPADIALGTSTVAMGNVDLDPSDTLSATLNDAAGSGKLVVTGTVALGDAILDILVSDPLVDGEDFVLIDNDGTDAITDTFDGLPEGAVVNATGGFFKITYEGGDGNDVVLSALVPDLKISANGKVAMFTDEDGDTVTMKTTVGNWNDGTFVLIPTGDFIGGSRLKSITIDVGFDGAALAITAKPGTFGGNGLVNIGLFDGGGMHPVSVLIDGDVGALFLGPGDIFEPLKPVKSVTLHSFGRFDDYNLDGGFPLNFLEMGAVKNFVIHTDVSSAELRFMGNVGRLEIGGSALNAEIGVIGKLGAFVVGHDFAGSTPGGTALRVEGAANGPASGVDVAIGSITIGGRVENAQILAGYNVFGWGVNADASIGRVKVGGMWIASTLHAGTGAGLDGLDGTGDDARLSGMDVRDNPNLTAQIASIVIAGQGMGTIASASDNFGIVSEWIKKAKTGGNKLGFLGGARSPDDRFFVATTGPGGDGSLSDFAILETVA
jgi:hypothetical protein